MKNVGKTAVAMLSYPAFNFCAFSIFHVTGVVPGLTNMWEQMGLQPDTQIPLVLAPSAVPRTLQIYL